MIVVKAFGPNIVTTYMIEMNNKTIMLDFNCSDIIVPDINKIDYIFISHEHLDHFESLLDYKIVKHLKPSVRIFSTKTTKELIKYISKDRMDRAGYNRDAKEHITKLIDSIEPIFFNLKNKLDENIYFYLYRSGHTFGSCAIHLLGDYSILYTGDIDYVSNNPLRQHQIPYGLQIDYLIVDGTRLFEMDYKGVSVNRFIENVKKFKNKKCLEYNVRPEKAVFYAFSLAEKMDDYVFVYGEQMRWYLKIIAENGYNPYIDNRIVFTDSVSDYFPDQKVIKFVFSDIKYDLNSRLSLHISKFDLLNILNNHIINNSKVLVGHYEKNNNDKIDSFTDCVLLTKGVNIIE